MFSEGNGGESRKSFHGYPKGYAQLIHSPESWHITPMQIDTRNRDCGVTPADVGKCTQFAPGPEPKQARYGRGIPAAGTNYSGLLECPCTSNYGGSPQYYGNDTKSKTIVHQYSVLAEGACPSSQAIVSAGECFDSVAAIGVNATKFVNRTVADPTKPVGCSVITNADGTATSTFNTAGAGECADSASKVAEARMDTIGVSVGFEMQENTVMGMVQGGKGQWCSNNRVNILNSFDSGVPPGGGNVNALKTAAAECERWCLSSAECNACSVDMESTMVWQAVPSCGAINYFANGTINGDISIKSPNTMARSPTSMYCSMNKDGVLAEFQSYTTTNATMMGYAIASCEAFCALTPACNACSADVVSAGVQWAAIPECGTELNWQGGVAGGVSKRSGGGGQATVTMTGPSAAWFAVGLNARVMSDKPYTLVANGSGVYEQHLGTCGSEAEHCPGDLLNASITLISNTVFNGVRTVKFTRPFAGASPFHYTFDMKNAPTIPFISAVGWDQVFAYHKAHENGMLSFANPAGQPTCICDRGSGGELCEYDGTGCGTFVKACVAEPNGDLLQQRNPTCNSKQYVGGLSCCVHNRIMLDEEQQNASLAGALLRYHMKWRFWFQEYNVAGADGATPTHYNLDRIYFQTEANAGEYDIPPAYSLPGNPVAGYDNWPLNTTTPGTTCTGTCPDGPDCECVHTIQAKFTVGPTRLIYAGGHCHAPACKDIRLFRNDTGHEMELLCWQRPKYGVGEVDKDKYDEAGYLALPPCVWGDEPGLNASLLLPPGTPIVSIKRNFNTKVGHYGEMASWQMRGVAF